MYTHFPSLASNKPNVHAIHADKKVFFVITFLLLKKNRNGEYENWKLVNEKLLCE